MNDITFSNIFFFIKINNNKLEYYIIGGQIIIIFKLNKDYKLINNLIKKSNFNYYAFYDYEDLYYNNLIIDYDNSKYIFIVLINWKN